MIELELKDQDKNVSWREISLRVDTDGAQIELSGADDSLFIDLSPESATRMASALIEGLSLANATGREIIRGVDEKTMVGIVMTLTGGWANPSVVRHHIQRIKAEEPAE